MAKNIENETVEVVEDTVVVDPDVTIKVIKLEDGYHVIDADGTMGPVCNKYTTDGYLHLSPNAANRKLTNAKKLEKAIEENGELVITGYKATRTIGSTGTRLPNEKLISYLPEELQAEYKAIIARAIEAREAAKAQPKTEKEKLEAKIAKAKAALEKLMAQVSEDAE